MESKTPKDLLKTACDFVEKHLDDSSTGSMDNSGNATVWVYYIDHNKVTTNSLRLEYFSSSQFFLINVYGQRGKPLFYIRLDRKKLEACESDKIHRRSEEPSTEEVFNDVTKLMNKSLNKVLMRPSKVQMEEVETDYAHPYGPEKLKNAYETIRSEAQNAFESAETDQDIRQVHRTKRVVDAVKNSSATFQEAFVAIEELTKERDKFRSFVSKLGRSNCWCEGRDNPMMGGRHTDLCNQIQHAMGV